ncbi:hypothetical protein B0B36_29455 [Pseudomonas syringae pv. actinidifoliorum]|nr:hypothetical protein B0B36_29455 [Pseudomonas syringae pv. actinidifoliorum]
MEHSIKLQLSAGNVGFMRRLRPNSRRTTDSATVAKRCTSSSSMTDASKSRLAVSVRRSHLATLRTKTSFAFKFRCPPSQ